MAVFVDCQALASVGVECSDGGKQHASALRSNSFLCEPVECENKIRHGGLAQMEDVDIDEEAVSRPTGPLVQCVRTDQERTRRIGEPARSIQTRGFEHRRVRAMAAKLARSCLGAARHTSNSSEDVAERPAKRVPCRSRWKIDAI